jgi:hypothetical protein
MIRDVVLPVRKRLISIFEDAQRAGVVRRELDAEQALDVFRNALYAGMLRNTASYLPRSYSTEEYINTVVDIFVRGVEAKPETRNAKPETGSAKSETRNPEPEL